MRKGLSVVRVIFSLTLLGNMGNTWTEIAFSVGERLRGICMEKISYNNEGYKFTGLLAMPKEPLKDKAPLVLSIGGLDGWKEARLSQLELLLDHGVAIFSLDMPGTGQSGIIFNNDAVPSLLNIICMLLSRTDIDTSRVVLYGDSFGDYWTTRLAAAKWNDSKIYRQVIFPWILRQLS